jgi:hypothetical protein
VTSAVEPSDSRDCGRNVDDEQPTTQSEARRAATTIGDIGGGLFMYL